MKSMKNASLTYRQAQLCAPQVIKVSDIPFEVLEKGDILLKILRATTCGTDLKTFKRGGHPKMLGVPLAGQEGVAFGHEFCGQIESCGSSVTNFKVGDFVAVANSSPCGQCKFCARGEHSLCPDLKFINGAYGQYLKIPARFVKTSLYKLNSADEIAFASLAEPPACVLHAVRKMQIQAQERVLVLGTGPMSFLFMQVLKYYKCHVTLVGRQESKLNFAQTCGADAVVNFSSELYTNMTTSPQDNYDVVVEAIGLPEMWQQAVNLVRRGGRVCLYGGCARGTTVDFMTERLHYDAIELKGVFHYSPSDFVMALEWLRQNKIDSAVYLNHIRGLDDLENIFMACDDASANALKFVIDPWLF